MLAYSMNLDNRGGPDRPNFLLMVTVIVTSNLTCKRFRILLTFEVVRRNVAQTVA